VREDRVGPRRGVRRALRRAFSQGGCGVRGRRERRFGLPAYPGSHHARVRTTNMLERLFREVKRRTRVVGVFPNETSVQHTRLDSRQVENALLSTIAFTQATSRGVPSLLGAVATPPGGWLAHTGCKILIACLHAAALGGSSSMSSEISSPIYNILHQPQHLVYTGAWEEYE
jgi:Transposase, Mutator family